MSVSLTPSELLNLDKGDDGGASRARDLEVSGLGGAVTVGKDLRRGTSRPAVSADSDLDLGNVLI